MKIHLHIERLVLEGLPTCDPVRAAIGEAVEIELACLLATGELMKMTPRHEAQARPVHLSLVRPNDPATLGTQIGRAVYQALHPSPAAQPHKSPRHVSHRHL